MVSCGTIPIKQEKPSQMHRIFAKNRKVVFGSAKDYLFLQLFADIIMPTNTFPLRKG